MTIYERMREVAKQRGLTVKEIEKLAKLGDGALYKWKTYTPRGANLEKVAKVLNVSVDYLLGNSSNPLPLLTLNESIVLLSFNTQVSIEGSADFENVTLKVTVTRLEEHVNDRLMTELYEDDRINIRYEIPLGVFESNYTVEQYENPTHIPFVDKKTTAELEMYQQVLAQVKSEFESLKMDSEITIMAAHWGKDIQGLPEEDRKKIIEKAKAYVEGLIDAYKD